MFSTSYIVDFYNTYRGVRENHVNETFVTLNDALNRVRDLEDTMLSTYDDGEPVEFDDIQLVQQTSRVA